VENFKPFFEMKNNRRFDKEGYGSSNLKQCDIISGNRRVNTDSENLMCLQDKEKNINYGRVDDTYNII